MQRRLPLITLGLTLAAATPSAAEPLNWQGTVHVSMFGFAEHSFAGHGMAVANPASPGLLPFLQSVRFFRCPPGGGAGPCSTGGLSGDFTTPLPGTAPSIGPLSVDFELGTGTLVFSQQGQAVDASLLPLRGVARICFLGSCSGAPIEFPLDALQPGARVIAPPTWSAPSSLLGVGAGGTIGKSHPSAQVSIQAAPWTVQTATATLHLFSTTPSGSVRTITPTLLVQTVGERPRGPYGFANSAAWPGGGFSLVTPQVAWTDQQFGTTIPSGFWRVDIRFVPEPGPALLLGSGALGLLARARLRRRPRDDTPDAP